MVVESLENREFYQAGSIDEATTLLAEHDAALISGGQSLMPLIRQGMIDKDVIVDISGIDNHNEITIDGDELRIGGLVTHHELIESEVAKSAWRALAETAKQIGDKQVRNWGTMGGSVAHADPTLDYPPTMSVLDARVVAENGESTEEIPIDELYLAPYTTVLEPDQIIVGVNVPRPPANSGVKFEKFSWRKGDQSLVNAAARITTDGDGEITEARICLGSVVPRPTRLEELEAELVGARADDEELRTEVANAVADYTEPVGEAHASVEYKNRIASNLTQKALSAASERAMEETQ